jgi:hypothetical protein
MSTFSIQLPEKPIATFSIVSLENQVYILKKLQNLIYLLYFMSHIISTLSDLLVYELNFMNLISGIL